MSGYYSWARAAATTLVAGALFTTCRENQGPKSPTGATQPTPPSFATSPGPVTLVGAGDIAKCGTTGAAQTANLLGGIAGTVFAIGDNAYPNGTTANYTNCYDPTWGPYKSRTYPAPGNHEYDSSTTAVSYFNYYGVAAGNAPGGYYSYDLGAWHVIVLNSSNAYVSTAVGSAQELWLKADLGASSGKCILAMWHHPRFYSTTSSTFYPTTSVKPFWNDLYAAKADLIINGHMHDYERFALQDPLGNADSNGIREIIAGTGGGGLDSPNTLIIPNSEVQISRVYGVLKLTLAAGSYSWKFVPVAGQTATDSGTTACHNATIPPANNPPTAAAGGPYSGLEGTAVAFDGSGSSDPDGDAITYAWSFGDGTTGTSVNPSHAYVDNGTYTVTLTVTDSRGAASSPVTTSATIANVAPAVNAGANQTAIVGSPITVSATFSDPGVSDAPWAYAFEWGDGSPRTTGSTTSRTGPVSATHTYTKVGTYTVRVTVTDKDGGAGSASKSVTAKRH